MHEALRILQLLFLLAALCTFTFCYTGRPRVLVPFHFWAFVWCSVILFLSFLLPARLKLKPPLPGWQNADTAHPPPMPKTGLPPLFSSSSFFVLLIFISILHYQLGPLSIFETPRKWKNPNQIKRRKKIVKIKLNSIFHFYCFSF